jgi:ATP-dependent Zn protease
MEDKQTINKSTDDFRKNELALANNEFINCISATKEKYKNELELNSIIDSTVKDIINNRIDLRQSNLSSIQRELKKCFDEVKKKYRLTGREFVSIMGAMIEY